MIADAATVNELVQHAVVSVVALAALAMVLRRVLGVFETRPSQGSGTAHHAAGCSHCATGTAGAKPSPRSPR